MDAFWPSWGSLGSNWLSVAVSWGDPWAGLGVVLEPVGVILRCLGHQKVVQSVPGYHIADIIETYESSSVFIGFRGWRLPSLGQNGILDAMGAQCGCLD